MTSFKTFTIVVSSSIPVLSLSLKMMVSRGKSNTLGTFKCRFSSVYLVFEALPFYLTSNSKVFKSLETEGGDCLRRCSTKKRHFVAYSVNRFLLKTDLYLLVQLLLV